MCASQAARTTRLSSAACLAAPSGRGGGGTSTPCRVAAVITPLRRASRRRLPPRRARGSRRAALLCSLHSDIKKTRPRGAPHARLPLPRERGETPPHPPHHNVERSQSARRLGCEQRRRRLVSASLGRRAPRLWPRAASARRRLRARRRPRPRRRGERARFPGRRGVGGGRTKGASTRAASARRGRRPGPVVPRARSNKRRGAQQELLQARARAARRSGGRRAEPCAGAELQGIQDVGAAIIRWGRWKRRHPPLLEVGLPLCSRGESSTAWKKKGRRRTAARTGAAAAPGGEHRCSAIESPRSCCPGLLLLGSRVVGGCGVAPIEPAEKRAAPKCGRALGDLAAPRRRPEGLRSDRGFLPLLSPAAQTTRLAKAQKEGPLEDFRDVSLFSNFPAVARIPQKSPF